MLTPLEAARRRRENPLWPYHWVVTYRDGRQFQQYAEDGYHYGREIDATRVVRLDVWGHPDSPIPLIVPREEPPDEIVLRAQVQIAVRAGMEPETSVWRWFGFRYGPQGYLIQIDDQGRIEIGVLLIEAAIPDRTGDRDYHG